MNVRTRTTAGLLGAALALMGSLGAASPASADDRQTGTSPLTVTVTASSEIVPLALQAGYPGTVSIAYGVPGAWAFVGPDRGATAAPGVSGFDSPLNIFQVVPLDGSTLSETDRQAVCAGAVQVTSAMAPAIPSVDLSTIPWLADGLVGGVLVWSDDFTGDAAWNPNLSGSIWTPALHGERISLVDTRLGTPREWNSALEATVSTYFTPDWTCTAVPPFIPKTGDESPAAAPDTDTLPVGVRSARIPVLDNDVLPNGIALLEVVDQPANGTATADMAGADWPIDYVPNAGFVGQDSFTYRVTDSLAKTSMTTVVVDVLGDVTVSDPIPDPNPVADPAPIATPAPVVQAPAPFAVATGIDADKPAGIVEYLVGGFWVFLLGTNVLGLLVGLVILVRARRQLRGELNAQA